MYTSRRHGYTCDIIWLGRRHSFPDHPTGASRPTGTSDILEFHWRHFRAVSFIVRRCTLRLDTPSFRAPRGTERGSVQSQCTVLTGALCELVAQTGRTCDAAQW